MNCRRTVRGAGLFARTLEIYSNSKSSAKSAVDEQRSADLRSLTACGRAAGVRLIVSDTDVQLHERRCSGRLSTKRHRRTEDKGSRSVVRHSTGTSCRLPHGEATDIASRYRDDLLPAMSPAADGRRSNVPSRGVDSRRLPHLLPQVRRGGWRAQFRQPEMRDQPVAVLGVVGGEGGSGAPIRGCDGQAMPSQCDPPLGMHDGCEVFSRKRDAGCREM